MPTHAELSVRLLNDAAGFFVALGENNDDLKAQMDENATVFEQMASLLEQDPRGQLNGSPYGELAGKLLQDAAGFFRSLAEQNEPLREQMMENANVYEQIGELVMHDPLGILD
ncbi:MAG: hypothetical protein ACPGRX_06500 [Bdellovibrionales bacterium]